MSPRNDTNPSANRDFTTENSKKVNRTTFSSMLLSSRRNYDFNGRTAALIVLNYPITKSKLSSTAKKTVDNKTNSNAYVNINPIFDCLWKISSVRIAADGGANRLYTYCKDYIPDQICGDLDSMKQSVRTYYEVQHNVPIENDLCQSVNDLDKALQAIDCFGKYTGKNRNTIIDSYGQLNSSAPRNYTVIVYGAFGGRFDQEMANFAGLYKWASKFDHQMYLYSDEACAFLIPSNTICDITLPFYGCASKKKRFNAEIDPDDNTIIFVGEGPTCGLIPLGCRCDSITTKGLKWDLNGTTPLEFGGIVSSSNEISETHVQIISSHPIVFTAEICIYAQ